MFRRFPPAFKGILLALAGYSGFSVADVGTKFLAGHYSVFQVVGIENVFSILVLLTLSPFLGGLSSIINDGERSEWRIHGLRGVLNFMINITVCYAFTQVPLTSVYTAGFMMPFVAALLAIPLYGEKVGWHRWGAIIVGFCGVLIAFQPWNNESLPPQMFAVLGAIPVIAGLMHLIAKSCTRSSAVAMAFWPSIINFILLIPFMAIDFKPIVMSHFPVFLLSGGCVGLAIASISVAFQIGNAASVSAAVYIQMLWGVVFGYLFFGDAPDGAMMAGAVVIILSGLYLLVQEHRVAST